jgi:hypothetical protein
MITSDRYVPPADIREHGRLSALAGRPIFSNPHLGGEAEEWFSGSRSVPEDQHGSRPELRTAFRTLTRKKKLAKTPRSAAAGVRALGDKCLPGSTPRPWGEL